MALSRVAEAVRPIARQAEPERLAEEDLRKLCRIASSAGADLVEVIAAGALVRDASLARPAAGAAGYRSRCWPWHHPLDSLDDALAAYTKGILLGLWGPPDMPDYGQGPIASDQHRARFLQLAQLVTTVESAAFYRGHHLAMGFGAGNCRALFCFAERQCRGLRRCQTCRHPWRSRPSLAAMGIDGPALAQARGWLAAAERPLLLGLVLVG